jgi:hypothetical protein
MTTSVSLQSMAKVLADIPWSLFVAIAAVLISWRAYRIAGRSLEISERNELRRLPALTVYLAQAYQMELMHRAVFMFAVSIGNPTDIDNSVARIELRLAHISDDAKRNPIITRFDHDSTVFTADPPIDLGSATVLQLPLRIDAHQTAAGWVIFGVPSASVDEMSLNSYSIVMQDTHGNSTAIEPIIIRRWVGDSAT